jgi:phosphotransferase system  glucose/maltose/N-acetylglucosamine-specific IIC component
MGADRGDRGPGEGARDPAAEAEELARRAERAAARAERERNEALALAEAARGAAVGAARRAGRFSREFLATVVSVVGTALGVVVALAWNSALTKWFARVFSSERSQVTALFVYALLVTFLAVVVIILLGRLARRLDTEPVEFKVQTKREEK